MKNFFKIILLIIIFISYVPHVSMDTSIHENMKEYIQSTQNISKSDGEDSESLPPLSESNSGGSDINDVQEIEKKREDSTLEIQSKNEHSTTEENITDHKKTTVKKQTRLGIGSGFNTSIIDFSTPDTSLMHIKVKSDTTVNLGIGTQYRTKIYVDPEIAVLFDAVQTRGLDMKKYLSGSFTTVSILGIVAVERKVVDAWNRKPTIVNLEKYTASWDSTAKAIIIDGNQLLFNFTNGWLNTDLTVNLNQMKIDTGVLVERKPIYTVDVLTYTKGTNWETDTDERKTAAIYPSFENSWIENKVEPTTISSNDSQVIYGQTTQDLKNEHPTNYFIELWLNNKLVSNKITWDSQGIWSYDFGTKLPAGSNLKARVLGKEKVANENQIVDSKYSLSNYLTIGNNSVPFDKWIINPPTISQGYTGDTSVSGYLPEQNHESNRSYVMHLKLIETNGTSKEILTIPYSEAQQYLASILGSNLQVNQKLEAWITGTEGTQMKESAHSFMVVRDTAAPWTVLPPVLDDVYVNSTAIHVSYPAQDNLNNKTYDLFVSINGVLLSTFNSIETYGGERYVEVSNLKEGDKITTKIIGHDSKQGDLSSVIITKVVKLENTAPVVKLSKYTDETSLMNYTLSGGTVMDTTSNDMVVSYSLDDGPFQTLPTIINKNKGQEIPFGDISFNNLTLGKHIIKISARDTEGLVSPITQFELTRTNPEVLTLVSVPQLSFGVNKISSFEKIYSANKTGDLVVDDSRISGTWKMSAKMLQPLTAVTTPQKKLENIFYINEEGKQIDINDANSLIYSSKNHTTGNTIISSFWGNNYGFQLKVSPGQNINDIYTGKVEWTLSDTP